MGRNDIDRLKGEVAAMCADKSKAAAMLGELEQAIRSDVEPVRLCIPEKDVVKVYDGDSVQFIRCRGHVLFHAKGGFWTAVSPRMRALYDHLSRLLDMKDSYESLDSDGRRTYAAVYSATVYLLAAPIYATADDEFFFGFSSDLLSRMSALSEKLLSLKLAEETPVENAEFENAMAAAREFAADGKDKGKGKTV